jgi:hypothetical protein
MKKSKKVSKVMREFKAGKLHSGKKGPVVKNPKQAIAIALSEAGMSKNKKIVKAEDGMMIEGAQSPSMMGAQAAPEALDRISEIDIAMAEEAARRRSLSALGEEKEKPMTPKERREKDIAERNLKKFNTKKKMGGGMMNEYKKGGMVRGQGIAIRGTKFKGIF